MDGTGGPTPSSSRQWLPVRGSLPLGVSADAVYEDLVFRLHQGETLTLYTVLSIRRLAAAEEPEKARVNLTAQIAAV